MFNLTDMLESLQSIFSSIQQLLLVPAYLRVVAGLLCIIIGLMIWREFWAAFRD